MMLHGTFERILTRGARGPALAACALSLSLCLVLPTNSAFAFQDEGGEKKEGEKDGAKTADEKKEDRWYCVSGGDVYTGKGGVLRGATVLSKNGKIEAIGYDLVIPPDTKTLDAKGFRVYPGLVAISS